MKSTANHLRGIIMQVIPALQHINDEQAFDYLLMKF